jgi:hypothetical protein
MKHIKLFENFNYLYDIEDIFLELIDDYFFLHQSVMYDNRYDFSHEYLLYTLGDTGYVLIADGEEKKIGLFDIDRVIDVLIRFKSICDINKKVSRIIAHDGEYIINLTDKLENIDKVSKDDILSSTHLHCKSNKAGIIDLENLKWVSCQIIKSTV